MGASLENCPYEIIEAIVVLLSFNDICRLRLSCRALAEKATQHHFESYIRSKRVVISEASLRTLAEVTRTGGLGCRVQDLTLVCVTNCAERDDLTPWPCDLQDKLISLLSQAFKGITTYGRTGRLSVLSLQMEAIWEVDTRRYKPATLELSIGWRSIWRSAAQSFHATLRAIEASAIPIETLELFQDELESWSLACDELHLLDFRAPGFAVPFASLKSLSISLSEKVVDYYSNRNYPREKFRDVARARLLTPANFIGLARFLQHAGVLEDLDICYYRLEAARPFLKYHFNYHTRLLRQAAESERLPKLNSCQLRGIYARHGDLLTFLKRTAPRRLILEKVRISGTYRTIFDYCTSEAASMEELDVIDLVEEQRLLVSFPEAGHGSEGANSLRRVGSKVKEYIAYCSCRAKYRPNDPCWKDDRSSMSGSKYGPPSTMLISW